MIGQISASNQLRTSSELGPNMFGASFELASVMKFGFYSTSVNGPSQVYHFSQHQRDWHLDAANQDASNGHIL